ncbi:MAG: hypothetical protein JO254_06735 [Pseudolabrys sp.]|nr:hypothetical protein [Pseudolabrys sp.]
MRHHGLTLTALLATAVLAGCAGGPANEMPAAAASPASASADAPAKPIERHEASAQCWMKYDKAAGGIDAKAKLVDKCIDEKLKAAPPR